MSKKYRIGIIGATGFTGSELVRILHLHPDVEIAGISSESHAGKPFSAVHSAFEGICDMELVKASELVSDDSIGLLFLALPHGVSMDFVKHIDLAKKRVVDLSADFRLDSRQTYEAWYPKTHTYPEGFENAVYGLPELFRDRIKTARFVGNPGCYPTSSILGLAPLVHAGLIRDSVIVDAKSGVTGAGVKPSTTTHFSNVNDNFKAYGLPRHRHTIEIEQTVGQLKGNQYRVQFTPHLLPVDRGILATIYSTPKDGLKETDVEDTYRSFYANAPFVRWRTAPPSIKDVRGTNYCDIFAYFDSRSNYIITLSAIDNLVKGAAGQAVQNMNLMLGMDEVRGLDQVPVRP